KAAALKRIPWLVHGFSTRPGGAGVGYGGHPPHPGVTPHDLRAPAEAKPQNLLSPARAGPKKPPRPLGAPRPRHPHPIHVGRAPRPGRLMGDGMITSLPGIVLGILTADCFPVLLVDVRNRGVGAFHCGWRPTLKRIVEKGLGIMRYEFGSRPQDIHAAIGPGIQNCCYQVGEEVKEEFESQFPYAAELFHAVHESDPVRERYPLLFLNARAPRHDDPCIKLHLDLREANRRQLLLL